MAVVVLDMVAFPVVLLAVLVAGCIQRGHDLALEEVKINISRKLAGLTRINLSFINQGNGF